MPPVDKSGAKSQATHRWWHRKPSAEWCMVVLTVLLAVIFYFQLKVTRDAMIVENTPYLTVKDAVIWQSKQITQTEVQVFKEPGRKLRPIPVIQVGIANTGNTPAINLSARGNIGMHQALPRFEDDDLPFSGDAIDNIASRPALGKDQSVFLSLAPRRPYTEAELDAMSRGKVFLVVHGIVHYGDLFGASHVSRFCYRYSGAGDDMVPCPTHNFLN